MHLYLCRLTIYMSNIFTLDKSTLLRFLIPALLLTPFAAFAQVRILFDATKGEMAGNADWVIDYDQATLGVGSGGAYTTSGGHQSNPQQIPTPAQSGINGSTPETFWSGAISSWGIDCVNKGYTVETLPWNGQISYNDAANAQDLTHYKVFVIDEPNIKFSATEKTALLQFVQNGGSLFMISDHNISDRNGDGWDSPNIWNDMLSNNSVQPDPFGITFDLADFSQTTTNIVAAATDSIIHGPMGNVTKAQWAGGTTMTLNPGSNASVKGVVYKSGSAAGNSNAMVAYARYGSGKVAAIGDSSPTDDGTGNPNCTLYNGYWADASGNHRLLLMNITIWLAGRGTSAVTDINNIAANLSVFPNPARGTINLLSSQQIEQAHIGIYDLAGRSVFERNVAQLHANEPFPITLPKGCYIIKIESNLGLQTTKAIIY
jgi:hypothetical protein